MTTVKTIWKFSVEINDIFKIPMPKGAEVLTVQTQKNYPHMWVLVDPALEVVDRTFRLMGTGHFMECDDSITYKYIGSYQQYSGDLIFHLFEII